VWLAETWDAVAKDHTTTSIVLCMIIKDMQQPAFAWQAKAWDHVAQDHAISPIIDMGMVICFSQPSHDQLKHATTIF
jgi:hypothetical protein